ncbi:MAG: DUF2298 domain-containing protein [Anaerolineae bacterium]
MLALAVVALVDAWPWATSGAAVPGEDASDDARPSDAGGAVDDGRVAATFALLCVAVGLLMAAVPELIYLKDVFNDRMNTVFKFFFQAWVLLSVGGGYALTVVWGRPRGPVSTPARARPAFPAGAPAWTAGFALLAAMVLYTPVAAVFNRTDGLRWPILKSSGPAAWSASLQLDGIRYWEQQNPDDLAAARWLDANAVGTPNILEAAGGGYDRAGRIAMISGFPTVLGADNHESQWQGTREDIDPRLADVEAFYTRMPAPEMKAMLRRYDVRFVVVGGREREKYLTSPEHPGAAADLESRLSTFMSPAFRSGQTTVWSLNAPSQ